MYNTAVNDRIWHHYQNNATESFAGARPRLEFLVREAAKRVTSPSLLNIGVGDGYLEHTALARGWKVQTVDPDAPAIARISQAGSEGHVGSIDALPQSDSTLDVVIATEVIEHLPLSVAASGVREIARVLKPGGWFLGTVPHAEDLKVSTDICPKCGEVFHRWGHQRSLSIADVREMLTGFTIAQLRRTAFVDLWGRGTSGFLKGAARVVLARAGHPVAVPSIYWAAQKP
jgi:SAM-dependent methyltransferase